MKACIWLFGFLYRSVRKVEYACQLPKNLRRLQDEMGKLSARKREIMRARMQQVKPGDALVEWITKVQDLEDEVGELMEESSPKGRSCLGGFCSTKLGKRVAKELKLLSDLQSQGERRDLTEPKLPGDLQNFRSSVDRSYTGLSTPSCSSGKPSLFDLIWRCLTEKKVRIIGVTGDGGSGKTALLSLIFDSLNNSNDFDVVIWVTVSKAMKLGKIQDSIGKQIGLLDPSWNTKSVEEKASRISRVLKMKKFVLLLDDIWERVDLMKLGVPEEDEPGHTSAKIVFTSPSREVCRLMEAQKMFRVPCLTYEEAWDLFRSEVGQETLNSHLKITEIAEKVVQECRGIPLALRTVARAMCSRQDPEAWEHALGILRSSAYEIPGMGNEELQFLRFSYDCLPNEKTRQCFLYCSLFPENYKISKMDLIDFWISEGFLGHKSPQDMGLRILDSLLRATLLEIEDDDHVKVHNVIRDMALWIANETERFLVIVNTSLQEAPETKSWEGVTRISLVENQIKNLSCTPSCPNLHTLFLDHNHIRTISSHFFRTMPTLKVLSLSYNPYLKEFPLGISYLSSLKHLNLSRTSITVLPKELEALKQLTYLNLEHTDQLHTIPKQLISNFSELQALRLLNCGSSEAADGSLLSDGGVSLIKELLCLNNLKKLSITITTAEAAEALFKFLSSHELQICAGFLCFRFLHHLRSLKVPTADMKCLKTLTLLDCKYLEELKIDLTVQPKPVQLDFNGLEVVYVSSCLKLRDLTWLVFASALKQLVVSNCPSIHEIISVEKLAESQEPVGSLVPFQKLESLDLRKLPKLKDIYIRSLPFPELKEITVDGCFNLNRLPLDCNSGKESKLIIVKGQRDWWDGLQWEDEAAEQAFQPCFKNLL